MAHSLCAPRTSAMWASFAGGVFLVVTAAVFLTTRSLENAVAMAGSSTVLTLSAALVLTVAWRAVADTLGR